MKIPFCGPVRFLCFLCLAIALAGCRREWPETEYGSSVGKSLNGTSVFSRLLESEGHEVRSAIRLTDELAEWADGIVRFAPYPGPPDHEEADWYFKWMCENSGRWLIYVVGDFDAEPDYWRTVLAELPATASADLRADIEQAAQRSSGWVARRPSAASRTANEGTWFKTEPGFSPPRVVEKLEGDWADGVNAAAAGLTVHDCMSKKSGEILLAAEGKPLVVEKRLMGTSRMLFIANGSFLLNEPLSRPARRALTNQVLEWASIDGRKVAIVEGLSVMSDGQAARSLIDMIRDIADLRWAFVHVSLAALAAALARAPRLGRARPGPGTDADRPVAHARALGALLARSKDLAQARSVLDRYLRWRHPRSRLAATANPRAGDGRPSESSTRT
jgi:hypothetical protein